MKCSHKREKQGIVIRFCGELGHHEAAQCVEYLEKTMILYANDPITLDLSGLTFMDSSGIAVILKTDRLLRQTGGALALCGVPRQVRRVLDVAGLTNIVPVLEDRAKECEQC